MSSNYHSFEELPLTLRVEDLMPILGIGRNTAYELIRCGTIRSIRIGTGGFYLHQHPHHENADVLRLPGQLPPFPEAERL